MRILLDRYINFLKEDKGLSLNTLQSYRRDIEQYISYMEDLHFDILKGITSAPIITYLLYLKKKENATATISRKLAAIRSFYQYLFENKLILKDPTIGLETPKVEKKKPEILTQNEMNTLLRQPNCMDIKGMRDKAMLEVLCATGIRVTELISLNLKDIDWKNETIRCKSLTKERVIHIDSTVLKFLREYIEKSRKKIKKDDQALFLNIYGKRMTRQGFWKIIKFYKNKAGISKDITPHTLRHSLAVKLLKDGTEIKQVKEILGHSDISSTNMYIKFTENNIKKIT